MLLLVILSIGCATTGNNNIDKSKPITLPPVDYSLTNTLNQSFIVISNK
jgi:hypothetical protein